MLSMNDYLDVMWKKNPRKLESCQKSGALFPKKNAVRINKTMIRPHLDYVDFVVESASVIRIKKLDTLEKKAIRRIEYKCLTREI